MGKKYIIEIEDDRNIIETFNGTFKGKCMLAVSARLGNTEAFINTNIPVVPYTEPDLEQVRKEGYEKGLSDAWKAARWIGSKLRYGLEIMGFKFEPRAVGCDPGWYVVQRYSASECIEKIRQYELFRYGRIPSEDAR